MMCKLINYDASIFPRIMSFAIEPTENSTGCTIDLPRGAYQLYLSSLNMADNKREIELFEKYAYSVAFTDQDYSDIIDMTFVPIPRHTSFMGDIRDRMLGKFGVRLCNDEGRQYFILEEEAKSEIRASTWDCIVIAILHDRVFDVLNCFDFDEKFGRKEKIQIYLGSYRFSSDKAEQKLSNALRTALFFTLAGYKFNLRTSQYCSFEDYFDNEYYKRVSLVYAMWNCRINDEDIKYIPLYDSFYNISGENKQKLIGILKAVLDSDYMAFDDKEVLKTHLIEGCNEIHSDPSAILLEQSLVKPAMNYIMLREKSKEAQESAEQLFKTKHYKDCATRCFYAMTFSLKALLEDQGMLADWKAGELKESETHNALESKLSDLISRGVLDQKAENDFKDVKDARWGCDYSIMVFLESDAKNCLQKMHDFCNEVERLTPH